MIRAFALVFLSLSSSSLTFIHSAELNVKPVTPNTITDNSKVSSWVSTDTASLDKLLGKTVDEIKTFSKKMSAEKETEDNACGLHTKSCLEKCGKNPKADCVDHCTQIASASYFDIMLPVANVDIAEACTDYCKDNKNANCFLVCERGYKTHYLPYPDHYNILCTNPSQVREHFLTLPTTSSISSKPTTNADKTCVDLSYECIHKCHTTMPLRSIARATCVTQCVHNTAVAFYDVTVKLASETASKECNKNAQCIAKHTSKYFPTKEECVKLRGIKYPIDVASNCAPFCVNFFGAAVVTQQTCTESCDASFKKIRRQGTFAQCKEMCGPQGVLPMSLEDKIRLAVSNLGAPDAEQKKLITPDEVKSGVLEGCWQGCFQE